MRCFYDTNNYAETNSSRIRSSVGIIPRTRRTHNMMFASGIAAMLGGMMLETVGFEMFTDQKNAVAVPRHLHLVRPYAVLI